jgi:hypothetical protein
MRGTPAVFLAITGAVSATTQQSAADLVSQMTLDEKIA